MLTPRFSDQNSEDALRIHWPRDPETLHPLSAPNELANQGLGLLYQSLLAYDDSQFHPIPHLAESMPRVRLVGKTTHITYCLRPEATWDNGTPILAHDVCCTLKAMACPGLPNHAQRSRFRHIQQIILDPTNPRRFTLICAGHAPEHIFTSGDYPILPEYALDPTQVLRRFSLLKLRGIDRGLYACPPILQAFVARVNALRLERHPSRLPGSGPYQMVRWRSGTELVFCRKPTWWADALPPADDLLVAQSATIRFCIIPDPIRAFLALRKGQLDVYPMMPADDFNFLQNTRGVQRGLKFYTADSYEMVFLGFNTQHPYLTDPKTRQALTRLLDVHALIHNTQHGLAYPSVGLISPRLPHIYNDQLLITSYSALEAATLLTQAGWERTGSGWRRLLGGKHVMLSLSISFRAGDRTYETIAEQFITACASLGIPVTALPTVSAELTPQLRAGDFQLYLRTLPGNPIAFDFSGILHSESIGFGNFCRFGTPESDELIKAIPAESYPSRKVRLLRKFQIMMREQCPLHVLFFTRSKLVASSRVSVRLSSLRPGYEIMHMFRAPAPAVKLSTFSQFTIQSYIIDKVQGRC